MWERGSVSYPEKGSPQGGVISPILSNVYLHEVLDKWFYEQVRPCLKGTAYLVRFADDARMIFSDRRDALRVMEALPKRFGKYGLTVHPEKTRLIRFTKSKDPEDNQGNHGQRETFNFLGFTHYWGISRKGNWVVKKKTEKGRFGRALRAIAMWCKHKRHLPVREQQRALRLKLQGHYNYFGVTGNSRALGNFAYEVRKVWRKWLARRGKRNAMFWDKFNFLLRTYPLPPPRIMHSVYAAKL